MRRNLAIAVGLLLLISLLARLSAPRKPEWEPSWREEISFVLDEDSSYYSEHLDIEKDAYKIRSHGCTGGGVSERGFVRYNNGQLELQSEKGETTTFAVTRQENGWRLDNPKKVYLPNRYTVSHLHPARDWFKAAEPLELEGLRLGMPRSEVEKRFPWHTVQDGVLVCFDRPRRKVSVTFDQQSRVCRITARLKQMPKPCWADWIGDPENGTLFRAHMGSYGSRGSKIRVNDRAKAASGGLPSKSDRPGPQPVEFSNK